MIIGAAFGKIVTALTDDFITPILSLLTGGINFANIYVPIGTVPNGTPETLAGMRAAAVPVFAYGHFVTEVIDFLIVRTANNALKRHRFEPFGRTSRYSPAPSVSL